MRYLYMDMKKSMSSLVDICQYNEFRYNDQSYAALGMNSDYHWELKVGDSLSTQLHLLYPLLEANRSMLLILGFSDMPVNTQWIQLLWDLGISVEWVSIEAALDMAMWCRSDGRPFIALLLPYVRDVHLLSLNSES